MNEKMELISTKAIAIISLLFTLQTLYVQALEPRQIIWKAEETRRDVCQYIEDYAARACKNGPNLMNCCSVVAAYEATACSCELTAADLNAQKSLDEYMAFKYTGLPNHLQRNVHACKLDFIGLGHSEQCTESRVASINFPFLGEWAKATDAPSKRRIIDGWVAQAAFLVYSSVQEQAVAEDKNADIPYCTDLAMHTASECAPTWKSLIMNDAEHIRLQHILTCCESLQEMTRRGCFCEVDIVDSLGGRKALWDLDHVATEACGFNLLQEQNC